MRKLTSVFLTFFSLALFLNLSGSQAVLFAEEFGVTRTEVEAAGKASVALPPQEVSTDEDLRTYATGAIMGDDRLETLLFNGESVEMTYRQSGALLGLVPISFVVRVVADARGNVDVSYPWFSKITIDNRREVETEVSVAASTARAASTLGSVRAEGESVEAEMSQRDSALLAEAVRLALRSRVEALGSVDKGRAVSVE